MKSTKLALLMVLLCGTLFACKKEEPAVAVEETPAPMVSEPASPLPMPAPMPEAGVTDPADESMDDDSPHSGGDKVGTGGQGVPEN